MAKEHGNLCGRLLATRRLATAALLSVILAGCAPSTVCRHSDSSALLAAARSVAIELRPYKGRLRIIPVRVAGQELPFLFDTAGGITVVSPDTAALAGCKPFGRFTVHRMRGERLDLPRCPAITMEVGGRAIADEVAVLDISALLPAEWPKVAGSLSLKTLESMPFTLELARNILSFESEASLAERVGTMAPIRARLSRPAGGAALDVFVAVDAGPAPVWLELDSGNIGSVLLAPETAAALGLKAATDASTREARQLAPIKLGSLPPVTVPIEVEPLIYDGNAGAAFIEALVLTFDLRRGLLWATPAQAPSPAPSPGT